MTPAPRSPAEVQRIADGLGKKITQRFVKSRWGWYVHTTAGCFIVEGCLFSFSRSGAERKAQRLARRLAREADPESFSVTYGEGA